MIKINILKIFNLLIVGLIIFLCVKYLLTIFNELSYTQIVESFHKTDKTFILISLLLTVFNYLLVILYDYTVARQLAIKIPVKHLCVISLITFTFNNNLGFGALLGGVLRFRFFSRLDIKLKDIGKYLIMFSWVYWVGLVFLSIFTFLFIDKNYIIKIPHCSLSFDGHIIGKISLILFSSFFFISLVKDIFNLKWKILFPIATTKRLIILTIVSSLDWLLLSGVFFLLLPHGHISYLEFFPSFMIAQIGAVSSHVPAGIGVFDALIIFYLKDVFGINSIVLSLIMFRLVYFFLPMLAAIILFILYERDWINKIRERQRTKSISKE